MQTYEGPQRVQCALNHLYWFDLTTERGLEQFRLYTFGTEDASKDDTAPRFWNFIFIVAIESIYKTDSAGGTSWYR